MRYSEKYIEGIICIKEEAEDSVPKETNKFDYRYSAVTLQRALSQCLSPSYVAQSLLVEEVALQ